MALPSSSPITVTTFGASNSARCFSSVNAVDVYACRFSAVLCGAKVSTNVFSEIAARIAASSGVAIRMTIRLHRLEVAVLRRQFHAGIRSDARHGHETRFERAFHEAEPRRRRVLAGDGD